MQYTQSIVINAPQQLVSQYFADPNNLFKWQSDLQSYEPLQGVPGQQGAQAKIKYQSAGRTISMRETVISRELPDHFHESLQAFDVTNQLDSYFEKIDAEHTRWRLHTHYQFSGYMRLLCWLFPYPFYQQTRHYQQAFKQFAEQQYVAAQTDAKHRNQHT